MAHDASVPIVGVESTPGYTVFGGGSAGPAHNEPAFRHLLAVERRRAERSGRSVVLVLVSLRRAPGRNQLLTAPAAGEIFAALGASVREVDFVGWFRHGHVAAAALIQRAATQPALLPDIVTRITRTLQEEVRGDSSALRVRVVLLGGRKV